jgi:non-heme chloroperoxidase
MKSILFITLAVFIVQLSSLFGRESTPPGRVLKTTTLPSGVTLEYMEQGDSKGIPVILLHGFTDSWKSFEAVSLHLPSSLHVFSVSQRGHGNSSKTEKCYKPADFAKDIADFIKQQQLPPVVIVGHSMGSTNAQCFATLYAKLTKGLVLMGSFADFDKSFITEFKQVINELNDPVDSVFIAEFQKSTVTRPISDLVLQGFINESRKVPASVWKGVAAGWNDASFVTELQSFNKPALIIWGDKDAICSKEDQLLLNKTLKKSELLVYEGTGHALHWEEPARFANDLKNFINQIK